ESEGPVEIEGPVDTTDAAQAGRQASHTRTREATAAACAIAHADAADRAAAGRAHRFAPTARRAPRRGDACPLESRSRGSPARSHEAGADDRGVRSATAGTAGRASYGSTDALGGADRSRRPRLDATRRSGAGSCKALRSRTVRAEPRSRPARPAALTHTDRER